MLLNLRRWWQKLKNITKAQPAPPQAEIYSGAGEAPKQTFALAALNATVKAASTGPDVGVRSLLPCIPDLTLQFDSPTAWACGQSTSLYDVTPGTSGAKAGDPIADCFAVVAYENHTLLAVADGVNWGEPAKRAARSAVLGAVAHLHKQLPALGASGASPCDTSHVFHHLIAALEPAQKLILAQFGTMTTLVITVVARLAVPIKHSTLRPASSTGSTSPCYHWAAMTITVGDSSAFVYRQAEDIVEDLTTGVHATAYRDPRWTPGALGYAAGEEPDLSNMTCSLTLLDNGDLVFLASDGVADNFDPFMLKIARQAIEAPTWGTPDGAAIDEDEPSTGVTLPIMDAKQSHAKKMELLSHAIRQRRRRRDGSAAGGTGASSCPPLSAQELVHGLLECVNDQTEAQRKWAERKHMAKEHDMQRRSMSREMPSLNTDTRGSVREVMPPGKMDHATIAALLVGVGT